jgi:outer membrane protein, multidrug efflux system
VFRIVRKVFPVGELGKALGTTGMILLILTGCATVGPDYAPPATSVPPAWHSEIKGGLTDETTNPETLAAWWTTFNDPELSSLIERAVRGNLDLKKAQAHVREARAQRGVAKAGLFPTLDAAGFATWSRSSKNTGSGKSGDLYSAGFDAGWELDVFGGLRRSVEAATADLEASVEDLRDVLVSLLAEVALNYVEVRTYQAQLATAEENITTQEDTFNLTLWRYKAGLGDDLSVQQARYNLENTRSQVPALRTVLEEALNRVAVLMGEQPGKIHRELEQQGPIPMASSKVALGVPADMLRRRPDVRRTERELAAQTARVGVATADLYPKFTLSGSIGLEALSLGNVSSSGISTLTGGPGISWAIFRAGAIRQQIEVQSALQEQALIKYEAAVLGALEEVENVLTAYAEEQLRRDYLYAAAEAAGQAAELARYKYEGGLTDFTSVLDTQRSLLSFQELLLKSKGVVASNLIKLYKALGGGWESVASQKENNG